METTNKKLADRITKGEVEVKHVKGLGAFFIGKDDILITSVQHALNDLEGLSKAEASAELIAEAFNCTNETGLSPRELKEQRDELIEMLVVITKTQGWRRYYHGGIIDQKVQSFLEKVKQLA